MKEESKVCTVCKEEKPLEEFKLTSTGGRTKSCRRCIERVKRYKNKNKPKGEPLWKKWFHKG